jgi:hypothetical protein
MALNVRFLGQNKRLSQECQFLTIKSSLDIIFYHQNSGSKVIFRSKIWVNLFILKHLLRPVPNFNLHKLSI